MSSSHQSTGVARALNDDREEIHDVATENAHVERVHMGEGGERSLKRDGAAAFERQPHVRRERDRRGITADAAEMMRAWQMRQAQKSPRHLR